MSLQVFAESWPLSFGDQYKGVPAHKDLGKKSAVRIRICQLLPVCVVGGPWVS
jgi:hypothetical protein